MMRIRNNSRTLLQTINNSSLAQTCRVLTIHVGGSVCVRVVIARMDGQFKLDSNPLIVIDHHNVNCQGMSYLLLLLLLIGLGWETSV